MENTTKPEYSADNPDDKAKAEGGQQVEPAKPKKKGGRPTDYREKFNELAAKACREKGATTKQLAKMFGVSETSIYEWKHKFPKFAKAIRDAKDNFDTEMVENALLKRALGYDYDEVTQEPQEVEVDNGDSVPQKVKQLVTTKVVKKQMPPEPKSIIHWLVNRNPERWRDIKNADISITNLADLIKAVHGNGNGDTTEGSGTTPEGVQA